MFLGYRSTSAFTRGTGFGGFMSLNLGLGFATGFGVQAVRPGFTGNYFDPRRAQNPDFTKVSWGLSGGDGKVAAMGLGIHWMLDGGQSLRRPDLDLGLLLRLRNYASIGAVARLGPADLAPQGLLPQELAVTGELALRPLGTRMLELAGGVRTRWRGDASVGPGPSSPTSSACSPAAASPCATRASSSPARSSRSASTCSTPPATSSASRARAVRGAVALAVSWDMLTVRAGLHAGLSEGVDGFGLAARFSSSRQGRVFWPRLVDAERIDLSAVSGERGLIRLLERLDRAEQAGPRSVILVDARGAKLGWASLQELRAALVRIRNAGGHVFAYLEDADLKDYYLASAAEQVYIHPAGELETFGLAATTLYFKGALDKLGVQAEGLHIAEYKSAHETFTRTGPSDPDRQQREAILDDTFAQIVRDIAQARGLSEAQVRGLVDEAPHGPNQALAMHLADKVVHRDEVIDAISTKIGAKVRFASFPETDPEQDTWSTAPYLAVVLIEGTIIDGESRTIPFLNINFTGSDTLVDQLRALRNDPMCKGILLRVNSPGGSALASDLIWREVQRTQDAHEKQPQKSPPIVVSMGDVAASGGYYVAMGARQIFASPTTITGSIGVVSLHFDLSGLLAKLGISTTTFQRGKNADITSLYHPYTEDQRARMDASMRRIYDLFRTRVAAGRKLTMETVDQLGRGHVYSGVDARELRLVDDLGGLHEALAALRAKTGLPERRELALRVLPRQRRLVDILLEQVMPRPGDDRACAARSTAQSPAATPNNSSPSPSAPPSPASPSPSCSSPRTAPSPSSPASSSSSKRNMSTVKLKRLKINQYRNVRPGTELRFDDGVNLVLGQNAAGKTTLLSLLSAVSRSAFEDLSHEEFELEYELTSGNFTIVAKVSHRRRLDPAAVDPEGNAHLWSGDYTIHITDSITHEETTIVSDSAKAHRAPRPCASFIAAPTLARCIVDILLAAASAFRFDESLECFAAMTGRSSLLKSAATPPPAHTSWHSSRGTSSTGGAYVPGDLSRALLRSFNVTGKDPALDGAEQPLASQMAAAIGAIAVSILPNQGARSRSPLESYFRVEGFTFEVTRIEGQIVPHDKLSYGQKRLLAFFYYLAMNSMIVIADELVNGLHHRWIDACMKAIGERQAFLTSQNPLLFEYVEFDSIEQVQARFITCKSELVDGAEQLVWQNMPRDDAERFYRGYEADIEGIGDILINRGLW